MSRCLLALLILTSSLTTHAAIARRFVRVKLTCWGGTFDIGPSVTGFSCVDKHDQWYTGYFAGYGAGGLITLSQFWIDARLRKGTEISGQYSGQSSTFALGFGHGTGEFTRNPDNGWLPDANGVERLRIDGIHLGVALDWSVSTMYITKI